MNFHLLRKDGKGNVRKLTAIVHPQTKCVKCYYCGLLCGAEEMNIDHLVPLSKGGRDNIFNKAMTCISCNSEKADMQLPTYKLFCKQKRRVDPEYPEEKIKKIGDAIYRVLAHGMLCFKDTKAFENFEITLHDREQKATVK